MQEVFGNLWSFPGIKCVTTNGSIRSDGNAVMGRGCALQAKSLFPALPAMLAAHIKIHGNVVGFFPQCNIFSFPVKHRWTEKADLALIEASAKQLVTAAEDFTPTKYIYLPRPGCGNGQLSWEEVRPVIEPILASDRFYIVNYARITQWVKT